MASCVSCGKPLGFNEKICQGCGAIVSQTASDDSQKLKPSVPPPPAAVTKVPAPPKVTPRASVKSNEIDKSKKSGFPFVTTIVVIILLAFAYWFWVTKQEQQRLELEANQAAEIQRLEEEAKAAEVEAARIAAEEAAAKAEEENAALKAEAERIHAEKEAALAIAREKEEEAKRAQELLRAQEADRIAREHELSIQRDRAINSQQLSSRQIPSPSVQSQSVTQINQSQTSQPTVNPNGFKLKFKGAFNATVAKRTYPTESMRDQAQKLWDEKKLILELDGTTTNPFVNTQAKSILNR